MSVNRILPAADGTSDVHGDPGAPDGSRTRRTDNVRSIGKALYLKIRIGDRRLEGLLDSGSEVSLLPASVAVGYELEPTYRVLRAANGTEINVLGMLRLDVRVGSLRLDTNFIVSDQVDEAIFGMDWMSKHHCVLKCGTGVLRIRDFHFRLHKKKKTCGLSIKSFCKIVASGIISRPPITRVHRHFPVACAEEVYSRLDNLTRHVRRNHRQPAGSKQDAPVPSCVEKIDVCSDAQKSCTPTQDEPDDKPVPVDTVVAPALVSTVDVMPSRLPLPVRSLKRPSLDDRIAHLEREWVPLSVEFGRPRPKKHGTFSPRTWVPRASKRALAAKMVGGVVRSVLSAPRGESLMSLKKRARLDHLLLVAWRSWWHRLPRTPVLGLWPCVGLPPVQSSDRIRHLSKPRPNVVVCPGN